MKLMLVDDERRVLEGLERVLRDRIDDIEIETHTSGLAALEALARNSCDVLITDMHMPGMDGSQLLATAHQRWPDMVRMVLSGHMDEERALKAVTHAHQFLLKPCNGDALERAVTRAASLRALLSSEAVRTAIGSLDKLPVIPDVYTKLHQNLHDPKAAVGDIVAVIRRDPVVSARTLQLASSALFAGAAPVKDLEAAVSRLGLRTLQALVLVVGVFDQSRARGTASVQQLEMLQERSLHAAEIASMLARGNNDAFMAALLGDIGQLVLCVAAPALFGVIEQKTAAGADRAAAEREVVGASHAEVGAYLLGLWGLPLRIVDAVRFHADPREAPSESRRLAATTHLALCAAKHQEPHFDAVTEAVGSDAANKMFDALKALAA